MVRRSAVEGFLSEQDLAVVGVSRNPQKFGTVVYNELKAKGYRVYPVNKNASMIGSDTCYPGVSALPSGVGGVVAVVPPSQTEELVKTCDSAGIRKIWMQRGAESKAAIQYCNDHGIDVVSGECILMHAEPVGSFHAVHRFFRRLFGRMPK